MVGFKLSIYSLVHFDFDVKTNILINKGHPGIRFPFGINSLISLNIEIWSLNIIDLII